MLPSILERKFFAVERKFLRILSIVASYVKSKCQALHLSMTWLPLMKFQPLEQDFDSGFPASAGRLSPFQDDLPSWSRSTPTDMDNGKMDKTDISSMGGLRKTVLQVKQSLASLEKQLHTWDSRLYEVVGEMAEKLRTLELPEWWETICVEKTTQTMLHDSNKPFMPSPPEPVPCEITQPTSDLCL